MRTYRFTIILHGVDVMTEEMASALYEAGCDDGSPGSGLGIAHIGFDRESESLESALSTAVADVGAAGYEVARVQIENDELSELVA